MHTHLSRAFPLLLPSVLVATASATDFLVVVIDDLGADKVGAYRDDRYPAQPEPTYLPDTPTLDTVAEVGLRFTTAYANPLCSPTRASLLTGRYPHEHDVGTIVVSTGPYLSTADTTLAELLAPLAGEDGPYTSALFGKWHLGPNSTGGTNWRVDGEYADAPNPSQHGFVAYSGNLEGQIQDYYAWTRVDWPVSLSTGGTGARVTTDTTWASEQPWQDAVAWAEDQPGSWLAVVSFNAVHVDGEGPADAWELDDLAPESGAACTQRDADARCHSKENYANLVGNVDARVGDLLDGLAEADLVEDLLVVVIGDNGTPASLLESPATPSGERTEAGKNTAYESGLRVPFLVVAGCDWLDQMDGALDGLRADGTPACAADAVSVAHPGLVLTAPVQVEDVFATVASLAGATAAPPPESVDLSACLDAEPAQAADCGDPALAGRALYAERFNRPYNAASDYGTTGPAVKGTLGARRGDLKIVGNIGTSGSAPCMDWELYDLAADPHETDDLLTGAALSAERAAAWTALWTHVRTDIAPDWLVEPTCAPVSPWDTDGDRYEDAARGGTDCDDADPAAYPGATEVADDGVDQDCDGADLVTTGTDADADGYTVGADCDDADASVYPGAPEDCDGKDDDCDGSVDDGALSTWYRDADADGFGTASTSTQACAAPTGHVADATDCNDGKASVNPDATEVCNNADDDCDGSVDEGVTTTWYRDADGDGAGTSSTTTQACTRPSGYSRKPGDCDDANAAIKPGAREVKNDGVDSNCNGSDNT